MPTAPCKKHDNVDTFQQKMINIGRIFQNNNYPANVTRLSVGENRTVKEEDQKTATVCLLYNKRLSRKK